MNLADILKDSNYKLSQFHTEDVEWLEKSIFLKQTKKGDTPYVKCLVRNKDIQLKPEEVIRQLYLKVLRDRYGYPVNRIHVEYPVKFGRETKKADIVLMDADRPEVPYIIVELKKPKEKDGKEQLKSYSNATGAPIAVWTNGDAIARWHRQDPNYFERITDIPKASQTLEDILQIKFTLEDLIANDRLVQEKKSLRSLIEEMEDEVLANAGVDVFEEVFKLIFTKLYDEWLSGQGDNPSKRILEFRNTGQTEGSLKSKIQNLFNDAKEKWEGVFSEDSKITLSPSHLAVCVRSLENVKLFNSNLEIIDEAFEYLVNQSSKGEKGQFFTPRYVIDMCVKMLNPKEDEYMVDTAAGSSGFPVHTIFHVWKQILEDEGKLVSHLFTMEDKPHRCYEYVQKRVFAIDFDDKSVRVARTLNLIAGDGQTNVLHLNTLDFGRWDEITKEEDWNDTYNEGFKRLKKLRANNKSYKEFQFDILMANPPFAGDIKESRVLSQYDLGKKSNGKWQTKVGRDILFIERNLDFLKPGGRMAIVLPQGRFNNSSDKYIRDYIAGKCRILAVVGLHGNTFKPHTGTKTSVLFVQKWNDDPEAGVLCPYQEDYNIFFATMQKSGKDNSGEKIYRRVFPKEEQNLSEKEKERDILLDQHGHLIVDHDLYNHDGMTEDGIAEAFIEFAKKEGLSFFESSPSVTPFDVERYKRLMGGLEATVVPLSEATTDNEAFRFDSNYFKKDYLISDSLIKSKGYFLLKSQTQDIKSFGAYSLYNNVEYVHEGIPFLRCVNIKNSQVIFSDVFYIDYKSHRILWKSEVKPKMVLLTMSGSAGNVAIAQETWSYPINSNQDIAKINCSNRINPYYLYIFLITKHGSNQIQRQLVGSVQQHIFLWQIEKLVISEASEKFQKYVEQVAKLSNIKAEESQRLYQQAEDLLLSELGLKDWQPTEENVAVKSFANSFLSYDRLDAEYYQPKYDEFYQNLEKNATSKGWEIKQYETLSSKFKYGSSEPFEYLEQGVPFLRIADLQNNRFSYKDLKFISKKDSENIKNVRVKTGDVLISRSGTLGLAVVIPESLSNAVFGSYFIVTRPNPNIINPTYLALYMNSLLGQMQTEQANTGGIQTNLTIPTIKRLRIICPPLNFQEKLVQKVNQSYKAEDNAYKLLEIAKNGVELAIEKNEDEAVEWMQKEIETVKIEDCAS